MMRLNACKVRLTFETNIEMNIPAGGVRARGGQGSGGQSGGGVGAHIWYPLSSL